MVIFMRPIRAFRFVCIVIAAVSLSSCEPPVATGDLHKAVVVDVRAISTVTDGPQTGGNTIGGALAGAFVFGPVGAVIGGLAGAARDSTPTQNVEVKCMFYASIDGFGVLEFRDKYYGFDKAHKTCAMLRQGDEISVLYGYSRYRRDGADKIFTFGGVYQANYANK